MGPAAAEAELHALRRAADQGDLNACHGATGKLLKRLPPEEGLELARQQLERRLPVFERHQPGITWPRELLEFLRTQAPAEQEGRRWPWEDEFPGPGANTFINGLDALWRIRDLNDEARRTEALVDAISAAIMAERLEAWGTRHAEQWAYWYESAGTGEADPRRGDILEASARDPESVRIKREGWHEVADRLAEALGLPPGR